jgi:hypothetical protein
MRWYSYASTSACQLASMMLPLTPTVPKWSVVPSAYLRRDSITTRTAAAVSSLLLITRTL